MRRPSLPSRDLIQPLALIDFESPELVDLPCPELLARFTPNATNSTLEVRGEIRERGLFVAATTALRRGRRRVLAFGHTMAVERYD